jgi:Ca-activated chloride channel family protein
MDFDFANPHALNWLWLVLALAALAVVALRGQARALGRFADHPLLARIAPRATIARPALRAALALAGMALLVLALMDPRWGSEVEEVRRRGAEVFLVVDVSRSMTAQDAAPSRLDRARQFAEDVVDALAGDRIGLIEFAGTAALRTPLTLNYGAFRMQLQDLRPLSGARGGTALANAIDLAAQSFPPGAGTSRAILVLSDGEDLEGGESPVEAARRALEERGVHVYTLGIGDPREGARIPTGQRGGATQYLVHDGQEVWSRMDERTLREIAEAGGGAYIPAQTGQVNMARAYEQTIGQLERQEFENATVTRRTPRFQWFAAVAFALLLCATALPDRRAPRQEVPA